MKIKKILKIIDSSFLHLLNMYFSKVFFKDSFITCPEYLATDFALGIKHS